MGVYLVHFAETLRSRCEWRSHRSAAWNTKEPAEGNLPIISFEGIQDTPRTQINGQVVCCDRNSTFLRANVGASEARCWIYILFVSSTDGEHTRHKGIYSIVWTPPIILLKAQSRIPGALCVVNEAGKMNYMSRSIGLNFYRYTCLLLGS